MVRSVFGDAIDIRQVRLAEGKWWPLQPAGTAMAPTGSIYFHPVGGGWSEDFALEPLSRQAFFIHEMTHVWQAQKGGRWYLPLMRHPFCRYRYELVPGRPFRRYGLEQQAEIVRHAFLLRQGATWLSAPPAEALEAVLPFRPPTAAG
jgi:hypothetical protein